MHRATGFPLVVVSLLAGAGAALAQPLPTTQPNYLQIVREEVKVGHGSDHARVEAGWPAAYEKAKSPYTYIALEALTGPGEVWFVVPFDSQEATGDLMTREDEPSLAAALGGLRKADAEHIAGARSILAAGRKDLSRGTFPDTASQRFYEVTIFRVRPGHSRGFEAAAKAYGAAAEKGAPGISYRVYEVIAGMPSPTYLVFSSVTSYGGFDKAMADDQAAMKAASSEETNALQTFSVEGLINSETIRFRLDPVMSYVPAELRAKDPQFWGRKVEAAATATQKPAGKQEVQK
jgi:hypothetical protein